MNYYYDLLLNFQEDYCMFYEWDEEDNIEYIKKIPMFHIDAKVFNDLIKNKIKVDKEFLDKIENKTKIKQNDCLKYACLFSDGKNTLALEFNDNCLCINKSSLMLDDELSVNEFIYSITDTKLNYEIVSKEKIKKETRQEIKIKKLLKIEIDSMYNKKEYSKLKFIYLEWFNELLEDIKTMYDNMLGKIDNSLTEKEYYIYEIIKLSYNNV